MCVRLLVLLSSSPFLPVLTRAPRVKYDDSMHPNVTFQKLTYFQQSVARHVFEIAHVYDYDFRYSDLWAIFPGNQDSGKPQNFSFLTRPDKKYLHPTFFPQSNISSIFCSHCIFCRTHLQCISSISTHKMW